MKITTTEINIITNEEIVSERELTKEELADKKLFDNTIAKLNADIESKAKTRQAVAERLGLTADELQLLLG